MASCLRCSPIIRSVAHKSLWFIVVRCLQLGVSLRFIEVQVQLKDTAAASPWADAEYYKTCLKQAKSTNYFVSRQIFMSKYNESVLWQSPARYLPKNVPKYMFKFARTQNNTIKSRHLGRISSGEATKITFTWHWRWPWPWWWPRWDVYDTYITIDKKKSWETDKTQKLCDMAERPLKICRQDAKRD